MFRTLPISNRCFAIPLPACDGSQEVAFLDPLVDVPYIVRSRLHTLRNGEPGWGLELELIAALTDGELEELVDELIAGLAKEPEIRNAILAWAADVRMARAEVEQKSATLPLAA